MPDEFNPYLKWLGIPLKHQPANCYRLLGLEPLESDPDVIESAADRQMAHVRTFQSGKRMELAQQVLTELAEARVTLLNAEKKSEYDAKLKQKAQAAKAAHASNGHAPPAAPPKAARGAPLRAEPLPPAPKPKALGAPPAARGSVAPAAEPVLVAPRARRRKNSSLVLVLSIAGVLGLALCAAAALVVPSLLKPQDVAQQDGGEMDGANVQSGGAVGTNSPATGPTLQPDERDGVAHSADGDGGANAPIDDNVHDNHVAADGGAGGAGDDDPPTMDSQNPNDPDGESNGETGPTDAGPSDGGPSDASPSDGEGSHGIGEETDPPDDAPTTGNVAPARPKPPAAQRQAEIRQRVRQLYSIANNPSPQEQAKLSQKLLEDAKATKDNDDDRYVMLKMAAEAARDAGDLETSLQAIDEIAATHDADTVAMQLETVERVARNASASTRAEVIRSSLPVLDAAIDKNRYKDVEKLSIDLLGLARRLGDRNLNTALIDRRRNAAVLGEMYDKAVAGIATLAKSPDDAQANAAVGLFWVIAKENWEKGLPYLAKGDDVDLADLAQRELDQPDEGAAQAELGNDWFLRAKKESPPNSTAMLLHARHWYSQAQESLTGLARTSAQRRLEEIEKTLGPQQPSKPAVRLAHITAGGDSGFQMYLNGEFLMRGDRFDHVKSIDRELRSGDVLTVMGTNFRGEKGFAAVIKFEGEDDAVVTGQPNTWKLFTPANAAAWFNPRGIAGTAAPVAGDSDRHEEVSRDAGVACASIWSNNQFRAYLALQIP